MKKQLYITGSIDVLDFSTEAASIILVMGIGDVTPICLNLMLLDYKLIDRLAISEPRKNNALVISTGETESTIDSIPDQLPIAVNLSQNSIQSIVAFLLQRIRDGYWSANHVDIELANKFIVPKQMILTIETTEKAASISGDDLKNTLGIK